MQASVTAITEGELYSISLDYSDEGVTLPKTPETQVRGTEEEANSYISIFDKDIRRLRAKYFAAVSSDADDEMIEEEAEE